MTTDSFDLAISELVNELVWTTRPEALGEGIRPLVCEHIATADALVTMCAGHRPAGLLCPLCLTEHRGRHQAPGCAGCGGPARRSAMLTVTLPGMLAERPNGEVVGMIGDVDVTVIVAGCEACQHAA